MKAITVLIAFGGLAVLSPAPIRNWDRVGALPEQSAAQVAQQQAAQGVQAAVGSVTVDQSAPIVSRRRSSRDAASILAAGGDSPEAKKALLVADEDVSKSGGAGKTVVLFLFALGLPVAAVAGLRRYADKHIGGPKPVGKVRW